MSADSTRPGPVAPAPGGPPAPGVRFELGEAIARGGMGEVYTARDRHLGREVAVKVLRRGLAGTAAERRFRDEAQITGQLQHPGVPPVYDLGTLADGRPFLALKLIRGDTLDALVKRDGPGGRWLPAFEGVCQAVAYAHAHSVVHRDLKPANVMVGPFGEVQVMDWGLAKLLASRARPPAAGDPEATTPGTVIGGERDESDATRAGAVMGTPAFMAPEQAIGAVDRLDQRTDVFGLGALLCALLTGQPPYAGGDAESTRQLAARGELADALTRLGGCGADPDLVALCRRCLAVEPNDRPADAGVVAAGVAALRQAADDRARRAELSAAEARVREAEGRKRRRLRATAGGLVLAVTLAGGLAAGGLWRRAEAERVRATAQERETAAALAQVRERESRLVAAVAREGQALAEAEGVVERFCSRVAQHPLLRSAGLLDLRVELLRDAAGHYKRTADLRADDPAARVRALDAEFRLATILTAPAEFRTGLALLDKQATELESQLAVAPGDEALVRRLARVHQERSNRLVLTRRAADALTPARRAVELLGGLRQASPYDRAYAHESLGYALEEAGRAADAEAEYAIVRRLRVGPGSRPADDGGPLAPGAVGAGDLAALRAAAGQTVTLQGVVRTVRESEGRTLTHLEFADGVRTGASAVIEDSVRGGFPADMSTVYVGRVVQVTGRAKMYKGWPQVVVRTADAVRLVGTARPPDAADPTAPPTARPDGAFDAVGAAVPLRGRAGQPAVVGGRVATVGAMPDGSIHFLNFDGVPRDGFAAIVRREHLAAVEAGLGGPLTKLAGRTVWVRGTVSEYRGRPQIAVTSAEQFGLPASAPPPPP